MGGQGGPLDELVLELDRLLLRGDLAREQVPEHGLWEHLLSVGRGGEDLLALWDGSAPEADALLRVEHRGLPQHGLDAAHAAKDLLDRDLAEHLVAVRGAQLLGDGLSLGNNLGQRRLDRLRRGEGQVSEAERMTSRARLM